MELFCEETGLASCNNIKLAVLSPEVFGGYVLQELGSLLAKKTNTPLKTQTHRVHVWYIYLHLVVSTK